MNEIQNAAKLMGQKGGKSGTGDAKRREMEQLLGAISEHRKAFLDTFPARFWNKVKVGPVQNCWPWTGTLVGVGYGQAKVGGIRIASHRVAYQLSFGTITDGLHVCHKCDNPKCCNPRHLFLGTAKDNYDDMVNKNRRAPRLVGEAATWSKFKASEVRDIRQKFDSGDYTQEQLAQLYGTIRSTIAAITQRVNWKHIK